jgi:hypothetical protein
MFRILYVGVWAVWRAFNLTLYSVTTQSLGFKDVGVGSLVGIPFDSLLSITTQSVGFKYVGVGSLVGIGVTTHSIGLNM